MWTADHTSGRREAFDESGEQPERRAAEQARDSDRVGETQSIAEEAEEETGGRKKGEQGTTGRKESNTLHIVFHFPTATASTTTATAVATVAAMQQHQ